MRVSVLLLFLLLHAVYAYTAISPIDSNRVKKHITFLAADDMKGRGTGTPEEQKAAAYIAAEFKAIGLKPVTEGGFTQEYHFKQPANPHATAADTGAKDRKLTNVMGMVDNDAAYTIIIGAHFDHLGLGHDGNSLEANPEGKIHNGADDNASGTAGVIELARYFQHNGKTEKHNYLFVCFSGEELGLFGSKQFCDKPPFALASIDAMINMDMIGRLEKDSRKLMVYGVGTAPEWVGIIKNLKTDLQVMTDSSGVGPSDQTSFYLKDIPVLHFFTGQHSDYHKPSDDVEKINFAGINAVLECVIQTTEKIDDIPKLKFLTTRSKSTDTPAFKVTLGIMPDYMFSGVGVHVDGVTEGKPAFKAGLLKGDVIVKLGEYTVKDMMDYMKALSKFKKGDTTGVQFLRGNELMKGEVTF